MTQTRFSRITFDLQPPAARIGLLNPPLNIIDIPMMEELAAALIEIEERPEIAIVILNGSQKAFSAGVDVAAHTPDKVERMLSKFHGVIRALITSVSASL
jgi:cyclohexa-1,5-dienecarbonyl-CoA hydratase